MALAGLPVTQRSATQIPDPRRPVASVFSRRGVFAGRMAALAFAALLGAGLALPVRAADKDVPPAGPCGGTLVAGSEMRCTIEVGGVTREFLIHVSTRFKNRKTALVLDLHGTGSTSRGEASISGWRELSDSKGFVVVYPQALTNGKNGETQWNAGDCCEDAVMADDLGFMRQIVAGLQTELKLDPKKVFATGLSSGGVMTHFIGCRAADVFRAIAPVSFPLSADLDCTPSQPIGMIEFHAPTDRRRSFNGFTVNRPSPLLDTRFLSVTASAERWSQIEQCDAKLKQTLALGGSLCMEFKGCAKKGPVALCTVDGARQPLGGHVLYRNDDLVPIAEMAWEFFRSL